jgi:lactoylglutathione lyase
MKLEIIGFIAATLTTAAFVPQALKTWHTRSTDDLSPVMFILFCIGVFGWLVYGIYKHDLPMIFANSLTLILGCFIMYFIIQKKIAYRISHIGLCVHDLEKMKQFYMDKFSAKADKKYRNTKKNFTSYFLTFSSGARLELMHTPGFYKEEENNNRVHLAISVGDNRSIDMLTEKLRKEGVKIVCEPRTTGDGFYESIVCDPEGNRIEITE